MLSDETEAWIRATSRRYAKRLVQEVKAMDTMETLIRRECDVADELAVIVIQMEDPIIHTDEHPFCPDWTCGCHDDRELIRDFCYQPWKDGILTFRESVRLRRGKQL